MKTRGAVICFQKYLLGRVGEDSCPTPGGPICLGYMGRVDVQAVDAFEDFIATASRRGANYACTRKQLLIYQLEEKLDQAIDIVEFDDSEDSACPNDGRLPFCSTAGQKFYALGCCSVLNTPRQLQDRPIRQIADELNKKLKTIQANIQASGMELEFAVTGLLGGEDLCLITLSNHFAAISNVMSEVQKMTCSSDKKDIPILENSHSILMVDSSGRCCNWGDAHAQIFFSSRSNSGISYLTRVYQALKNNAGAGSEKEVSLEGRYGDYDIVLRCPAHLLRTELYCGEDGLLSYDNPAYRNAVYQSETIVSPFGCSQLTEAVAADIPAPDGNPMDERPFVPDADLDSIIEQVMKEVARNLLGTEEDRYHELTHIHLALYRLLKDYRHIMADSFNVHLHNDLTTQFYAAVNAIVVASQPIKVKRDSNALSKPENFNAQFDDIVSALNSTMLIADQVDRFYFTGQLSHLQNTGSYHKILLAYYGFIKDVLRLLYSLQRDAGNVQPLLVPMLSFGLGPIANSRSFPSFIKKNGVPVPAKLICIKLPYQALANPPKYLGILIHELFHYLHPLRTSSWNRLLVTCLARNAICEFIGILATGLSDVDFPVNQNIGAAFYCECKKVIDPAAAKIADVFFQHRQNLERVDPETLWCELSQYFLFHKSPKSDSYQFYRSIWKDLNNQFSKDNLEKKDLDLALSRLLVLKEKEGSDRESVNDEDLDRVFADLVRAVPDFDPLGDLLFNCYKALLEVTADLFDLGIVLYREPHNIWAQEFFWQIHTTQNALLGADTLPSERLDSALLSNNMIRFGILMDYCLKLGKNKSEDSDRFSNILWKWCDNSQDEGRLRQVQTAFRRDYNIYLESPSRYSGHEQKFLDMICETIKGLWRNPECVKIAEKMSGFYLDHCKIMDEARRKGKDPALKKRNFDLCVKFIETYQTQESVQDLKAFPTVFAAPIIKVGLAASDEPFSQKHPERKFVEYPADLSWAVSTTCEKMSVAGKPPLLWYRGQQSKYIKTLPGILRENFSDGDFLTKFCQEAHLARTQILPLGADFTEVGWLAFLQHNGFPTNVLDFSESFYPALYFAIQKWIDQPEDPPECDSHIAVLNPVLFNLAMRALDEIDSDSAKAARSNGRSSLEDLKEYLEKGTVEGGIYRQIPLFARSEKGIGKKYKYYFSWDQADKDECGGPNRPITAFVPKNSERMRQQTGQFVFYDLRRGTHLSMEELCKEYSRLVEENGLPHIPFLYEIRISRFQHRSFVNYVRAIGLRKYHIYPELDKLAIDVKQQLR